MLSVCLSQGGFETHSVCSGEGWVYVPGVFTTLNIRPLGIIQRNSICRKGCSAKSVCPMGGLKSKNVCPMEGLKQMCLSQGLLQL